VREQFADRVLHILEGYAPGLAALVRGRTAFSPEDLRNANANLVGGDSVSGSHHLDQFLMLRPSLRLSRYRTSIPGLYLAGAGTWPGAGVNGISGQLAAEALLRSRRRRP
jgi:phytoene dehydrogenase-like protein